MPVDDTTFRRTLGQFATGVTVITTWDSATDQPVGVTINSFSSLSLDPPLVLFCLALRSPLLEVFRSNGHYAVNILAQEQSGLSSTFAQRGDDKFAEVSFRQGAGRVPVIDGCVAALECEITGIADGGDHAILIGRVTHAEYRPEATPLLYFRGGYLDASQTTAFR